MSTSFDTRRRRDVARAALHDAQTAITSGDDDAAWAALERAHIAAQPLGGLHVAVHLRMLCFAWKRRLTRELLGQLPRLLLAAPGSWLGRYPKGNTGRSHVSMFAPMPIAPELAAALGDTPAR